MNTPTDSANDPAPAPARRFPIASFVLACLLVAGLVWLWAERSKNEQMDEDIATLEPADL